MAIPVLEETEVSLRAQSSMIFQSPMLRYPTIFDLPGTDSKFIIVAMKIPTRKVTFMAPPNVSRKPKACPQISMIDTSQQESALKYFYGKKAEQ